MRIVLSCLLAMLFQLFRRRISVVCVGVVLLVSQVLNLTSEAQPAAEFVEVVLKGMVTDTKGKPVDKASVILSQRRETYKQTSTDPQGVFELGPLQVRVGTYEVSATAQGYEPTAQRIVLFPRMKYLTDIVLRLLLSSSTGTPTQNVVNMKVFFATDREGSSSGYFGSEPNNSLPTVTLGSATVPIPRDHRIGQLETAKLVSLGREPDPKSLFVVATRQVSKEAEFYSELKNVLNAPQRKQQVLVFIHGYNVSFDDALLRTAQIAYDLDFLGAPLLYSWPSNGDVVSYVPDTNKNDWTIPHLSGFLLAIGGQLNPSNIHIFAHSMGSRALVQAMDRMSQRAASSTRFGHLVFAAPDVDSGVFKQLGPALQKISTRTTLYASSKDRALILSKALNGYPRAGDSEPTPLIVAGIDSIDVSAVDTDFLGLRHSYYADKRSLLSDVFYLLTAGLEPEKRFGIRGVGTPPLRYWVFKP
jgi:esterase/lipase superfamily enzyme